MTFQEQDRDSENSKQNEDEQISKDNEETDAIKCDENIDSRRKRKDSVMITLTEPSFEEQECCTRGLRKKQRPATWPKIGPQFSSFISNVNHLHVNKSSPNPSDMSIAEDEKGRH